MRARKMCSLYKISMKIKWKTVFPLFPSFLCSGQTLKMGRTREPSSFWRNSGVLSHQPMCMIFQVSGIFFRDFQLLGKICLLSCFHRSSSSACERLGVCIYTCVSFLFALIPICPVLFPSFPFWWNVVSLACNVL